MYDANTECFVVNIVYISDKKLSGINTLLSMFHVNKPYSKHPRTIWGFLWENLNGKTEKLIDKITHSYSVRQKLTRT
jgi:hypothetical protein